MGGGFNSTHGRSSSEIKPSLRFNQNTTLRDGIILPSAKKQVIFNEENIDQDSPLINKSLNVDVKRILKNNTLLKGAAQVKPDRNQSLDSKFKNLSSITSVKSI